MGCGCNKSKKQSCQKCCPTDLTQIYAEVSCIKGQISDLTKRDSQLKAQVELNNETESPYEALCPVRTCESCIPVDDCSIGKQCTNESVVGKPVGSECDPTCGQDAASGLAAQVNKNSNEIRKLQRRLTQLERQIEVLNGAAITCVLLDNQGNARGGLTQNGTLITFKVGSWNDYNEAQEENCCP